MTETDSLVDMVLIGAGRIELRDDRQNRRWEVDLPSFLIAKYPVTERVFARLAGVGAMRPEEAVLPIVGVSWIDAALFCNRLSERAGLVPCYTLSDRADGGATVRDDGGYRMAWEAEWEFACRAGSRAPRYGPVDEIAWYAGNSDGTRQPVGLKRANDWGLHDMLGNVWEWCSDQYDPAVYGTYRTFRGGGWADQERGVFAGNRRRSHPTFKIDDLGFRVVRTARAAGSRPGR